MEPRTNANEGGNHQLAVLLQYVKSFTFTMQTLEFPVRAFQRSDKTIQGHWHHGHDYVTGRMVHSELPSMINVLHGIFPSITTIPLFGTNFCKRHHSRFSLSWLIHEEVEADAPGECDGLGDVEGDGAAEHKHGFQGRVQVGFFGYLSHQKAAWMTTDKQSFVKIGRVCKYFQKNDPKMFPSRAKYAQIRTLGV